MNQKHSWLLNRLLIPAGILPPAIKFADLAANEQTRQKIGNTGFEYFLILDQDPDFLNNSAVGKKIHAIHFPWPEFPMIAALPEPLKTIANQLTLGKDAFPRNHIVSYPRIFSIAKSVGAKVLICHISFLDHHHLAKEFALLARLEKDFQIPVAIEHEALYAYQQAKTTYFLQAEGNYHWMVDPVLLDKTLSQMFPGKKFRYCLDSASLINSGLPVVATARKIYSKTIHYHLANNPVGGHDIALEINNQENVDLVNFLYQRNYSRFFTAEVSGTVGKKEEILARLYATSAVLNLKVFKKEVYQNAQRHIENSCRYLLDNFNQEETYSRRSV